MNDHRDAILFHISRHLDTTYLVLTKRSRNMADYFRTRVASPNLWLGTTIEHPDYWTRLIHLKDAAYEGWAGNHTFLSCEPLLGRVSLGKRRLHNIGWVIAGAETGPHARPCNPDWLRALRDQCGAAGVPFFLKKTHAKDKDGVLDGRQWREFPESMKGGAR